MSDTKEKKKKKKSKHETKVVKEAFKLYTLETLLGEGTYGKVYKALDIKNNRVVAIKVIPVDEQTDMADLEKEIRVLKKCKSKYIVKYIDSFLFPESKSYWIVLEFCELGSVDVIMGVLQITLTEEQVKSVVVSLLKAMVYLHSRKQIHRDIKAGNILVNGKGEIKIGDFGVCAELSNTLSKRNTVIGTPYWMAPEVIEQTKYDDKADVWSVGITIIEMVEGKPPHSEIHPLRAIFMIPFKPSPTLKDEKKWSPQMRDFIKKCVFKDPKLRPTTKELLAHEWLRNSKDPKSTIYPLCEKVKTQWETAGGRLEFFKKMEEERRKKNLEKKKKSNNNNNDESDDDDLSSDSTSDDEDDSEESGDSDSEVDEEDDDDYDSRSLIIRNPKERQKYDSEAELEKLKKAKDTLTIDTDDEISEDDDEGGYDSNTVLVTSQEKRDEIKQLVSELGDESDDESNNNKSIRKKKKKSKKNARKSVIIGSNVHADVPKSSKTKAEYPILGKFNFSKKGREDIERLWMNQLIMENEVSSDLAKISFDKISTYFLQEISANLKSKKIDVLEKCLNVFDKIKNKKICQFFYICEKIDKEEKQFLKILSTFKLTVEKFQNIQNHLKQLTKIIGSVTEKKNSTFKKEKLEIIKTHIREIEKGVKQRESIQLNEKYILFCNFIEETKKEAQKLLFYHTNLKMKLIVEQKLKSLSDKVFGVLQRITVKYNKLRSYRKNNFQKKYLSVKKKLLEVLKKKPSNNGSSSSNSHKKSSSGSSSSSSNNNMSVSVDSKMRNHVKNGKEQLVKKKIGNGNNNEKSSSSIKMRNRNYAAVFEGEDYDFYVYKKEIEFGKKLENKVQFKDVILFERHVHQNVIIVYNVELTNGKKFDWRFRKSYNRLKKFEKLVIKCIQSNS